MRIAFLTGRFPVVSETFILNQIAGCVARGHEVDVYALQGGPRADEPTHPAVARHGLLARTHYPPRRPRARWLRRLKGYGLLLGHLPRGSLACRRIADAGAEGRWLLRYRAIPFLGARPYDVVHCEFGYFGPTAVALRRAGILRGRILTTFRGSDISRHVERNGARVYEELFAAGDHFFANCEFFRQRAIALGCPPDRIEVHGSGIDCGRFRFAARRPAQDGVLRVATTGRLVEKKGIEYAVRAVAGLAGRGLHAELVVAGDGPLRAPLERLARGLGVGDAVRWLGSVEQTRLVEVLDGCQLFVAPSVTAADGNQDAPVNTLKEAMAMGLPVVATRHGGIPELVEEGVNGFLVPERDARALEERLAHLAAHPELWPRLGRAGRAAVEQRYDIEKLNDELLRVYRRLAAAPAEDVALPGTVAARSAV